MDLILKGTRATPTIIDDFFATICQKGECRTQNEKKKLKNNSPDTCSSEKGWRNYGLEWMENYGTFKY